MDTDNVSLKEGIRSESCLVRYVAVVNAVLIAALLLFIVVLVPVSFRLQRNKDRKQAEDYYDRYYKGVANYIEDKRDRSHSEDSIRKNVDMRYTKLFDIQPEKIIGRGILDGKSRGEIIDDLIDEIADNRWFGWLDYDNPATDMIRLAIIGCIADSIIFAAVLVTVIIVQEHRYVNADEKTVSLSRRVSVLLPDVIRAETGFPKSVTVVTDKRRYKRRFIRNNHEIVKFINERCNNAAQ